MTSLSYTWDGHTRSKLFDIHREMKLVKKVKIPWNAKSFVKNCIEKYSARVHMANDALAASASPPYERVPNI